MSGSKSAWRYSALKKKNLIPFRICVSGLGKFAEYQSLSALYMIGDTF